MTTPQPQENDTHQPAHIVPLWTGTETQALRLALRTSIREFAAKLGVSDRLVSYWEAAGSAITPRPLNQTVLDHTLATADPDTKARFTALTNPEPDHTEELD